jgi:hypothetical protein
VFGKRAPLVVSVATTRGASVTVSLKRKGAKGLKRKVKTSANRLARATFSGRKLRRGLYTMRVKVKAGKQKAAGKLFATRL